MAPGNVVHMGRADATVQTTSECGSRSLSLVWLARYLGILTDLTERRFGHLSLFRDFSRIELSSSSSRTLARAQPFVVRGTQRAYGRGPGGRRSLIRGFGGKGARQGANHISVHTS